MSDKRRFMLGVVIYHDNRNYQCICCDENIAVFCKRIIVQRLEEEWVEFDFKDVFAVSQADDSFDYDHVIKDGLVQYGKDVINLSGSI